MIERLARRVQAYQLTRHRSSETYPEQAPRGPVVFLTNQWSGSDRQLDGGPIVGVRTWGGVVGMDGLHPGGRQVGDPAAVRDLDQGPGFSVENYGVDPDIEVAMTPADHASSRDRQLDAGIAELFRRLAENPASSPPDIPPLGD